MSLQVVDLISEVETWMDLAGEVEIVKGKSTMTMVAKQAGVVLEVKEEGMIYKKAMSMETTH